MRPYDAALLAVGLSALVASICLVALLKAGWRRPAWVGLRLSVIVFVVALVVGAVTSPPKDVLEAEAATRAAQADQASREKAVKDAAEAAAKAAQREQAERERLEKAAAAAEATRMTEAKAAEQKAADQKRSEAETAALRAPKPMTQDAIGCVTREANDRLTKISVSGDKEAFAKLATALIAAAQCRLMKMGTRLYLEDTAIFSGLICGRPAGETRCYWLPIEITQ